MPPKSQDKKCFGFGRWTLKFSKEIHSNVACMETCKKCVSTLRVEGEFTSFTKKKHTKYKGGINSTNGNFMLIGDMVDAPFIDEFKVYPILGNQSHT